MKIPQIIHQTWKTEKLPDKFRHLQETWKIKHPLWKYILWTDEMNREFIEQHFHWFLKKYDKFTNNIQRVDAVRYFILYLYGGVFVDLDFECIANIGPLLESATCVLGREPEEHCRIHGKDMIVSNAFIACIPGHDFIKALCDEVASARRKTRHKSDRILDSTGPFMLTRVLKTFPRQDDVRVLEAKILYPLPKSESDTCLNSDDLPESDRCKLKDAYAIHYYVGSWWKKDIEQIITGE
jgi:mannosyltransferase OCH1-like enzyme